MTRPPSLPANIVRSLRPLRHFAYCPGCALFFFIQCCSLFSFIQSYGRLSWQGDHRCGTLTSRWSLDLNMKPKKFKKNRNVDCLKPLYILTECNYLWVLAVCDKLTSPPPCYNIHFGHLSIDFMQEERLLPALTLRQRTVGHFSGPSKQTCGDTGARGGSRTHMRKNPRRILSPQRLPFRHPGKGRLKT